MLDLILNVGNSGSTPICLGGLVCANDTFISIYGVIFTIVISLGVYIYGIQEKSAKITLTKSTDIRGVITKCLGFFALSFLALPNPFYELLNFTLVGALIFNLFIAFKEVFKFNENELSAERAVKKFKEGVIKEKLKQFEDLKIRNDELNKLLEERRESKEIERFLFDENDSSYHFIRAQASGYITNLDLNALFARETSALASEEVTYYIPYSISNGAPIDFDDIILGVKKSSNQKIDEERLRSYVSISDEYENPSSYFEAEMRSYYSEMFNLIKMENSKGLELKLKEFSSFVDHFTKKADSYIDIIQFINTDIVYPLQKYAFKLGDIDCIRKIVSFSLEYIYQSINKKSVQIFNIFLRNFGYAFYESFTLENKVRLEFYDAYFRWLNEIVRYSIKSKVQKDKDYIEYATNFLSGVNGWLKIAFDNKDIDSFDRTISFLNNSFSRETYEFDEDKDLDDLVLIKKAVIFGFTAWVYKYYNERKDEEFYKHALTRLLGALQKDTVYYYGNVEDDLNYYLSLYLQAVQLSESKGTFGWDMWDMPEGRVSVITIRSDIKNLLADRILKTVSSNPTLSIDIRDRNYNDELSYIKEGNQQFDPLMNKTKDSLVATIGLSQEQFEAAKVRFYEVFTEINKKYEEDVRVRLIEQPLDDTKFNTFAKATFESYERARVMYRIHKFGKKSKKENDGFGYNVLLPKDQFVKVTNVHYIDEGQFGENLARSEDNKLLESIYKKISNTSTIEKSKIGQFVSKESNLNAIVLWLNGYVNIEDTNPDDFKPYWHQSDSRKDNGPYYQGSINGIPVYIVYKLQEHKSYPDSIFAFKEDGFDISEFEIEQDKDIDIINTKFLENSSECLTLSITNLSNTEEIRRKIVEKWMKDDPTSVKNVDDKIEELRTSVVFKLYKGLSTEEVILNKTKIIIFHIK